ncbi:MAG TPA: hypothetical protein VEU30_06010 [Thermoanaerobaculia bacterium]|nr:hypothetical protein [Thermoanaerobaculia bacterium]
MRKATIILLLLTLSIATAAFADGPAFGSGARSDSPMVGSGVGDGPALGSGVGDGPTYGSGVGDTAVTTSMRTTSTTSIFTLIRLYLGM